jgi:O-antigen/teichoic acid export membrane protein
MPFDALLGQFSQETRGFTRDSFVLSVGSAIAVAGYMVQVVLITHILGLREYGTFAIVVSFVALVNGFFDVQIGDTAIAFSAREVASPSRAAGVIQMAYAVELVTGVAAFAVVAALAPYAGARLAGDEGPLLFLLYGMTLLASTAMTTSIAVLRLVKQFGVILRLVALREVIRVGAVALALIAYGTLASVAIALFALEALIGVLAILAAARGFSDRFGQSLRRSALREARDIRRSMLGMIFHTNIVTYAKLVQSQAPTLLLGAMTTPLAAGAYKVGMAVASAVAKPGDPAWAAIMPRLSRLWAEQQAQEIRRMVQQASVLAALIMGSGAVAAFLLRNPLLTLIGGKQAAALAPTVLVLGLIGSVINGALFWNTPLIYSARRAAWAMKAYLAASLFLFPLLVVFIDRWGANGAAGAILAFTLLLNLMLTRIAVRLIREVPEKASREQLQPVDERLER